MSGHMSWADLLRCLFVKSAWDRSWSTSWLAEGVFSERAG